MRTSARFLPCLFCHPSHPQGTMHLRFNYARHPNMSVLCLAPPRPMWDAQIVHALESITSQQPTNPCLPRAALGLAFHPLLSPPQRASTTPTDTSNTRCSGHCTGGVARFEGALTPSTSGWLSWLLPLLAGQLVRALPAAPAEVGVVEGVVIGRCPSS